MGGRGRASRGRGGGIRRSWVAVLDAKGGRDWKEDLCYRGIVLVVLRSERVGCVRQSVEKK